MLFIGAGVGAGAGLPSWEGLLDKLENIAELDGIDKQLHSLDRAKLIENRLSEQSGGLRSAVIEEFGKAERYALGHALLAGLPVDEAVTTNASQLLQADRGGGSAKAGDPA